MEMQYLPPNTVTVSRPKSKEERAQVHAHAWPIHCITVLSSTKWGITYVEPPPRTTELWAEEQERRLRATILVIKRKLEGCVSKSTVTFTGMDGTDGQFSLPRSTNAGELRAQVSSHMGVDKYDQELYVAATNFVAAIEDDNTPISLREETTVSVIVNVQAGHAARFKSRLHFGTTEAIGLHGIRRSDLRLMRARYRLDAHQC